MKYVIALMLTVASATTLACDSPLLDAEFKRLASTEQVNLCEAYSGKVLLVVNTASKCGNTPQYDGLEKLYEEYGDEGLVSLLRNQGLELKPLAKPLSGKQRASAPGPGR